MFELKAKFDYDDYFKFAELCTDCAFLLRQSPWINDTYDSVKITHYARGEFRFKFDDRMVQIFQTNGRFCLYIDDDKKGEYNEHNKLATDIVKLLGEI